MNYKLVLGAGLPLMILVVLVILSISGAGFSVEQTVVDTIDFQEYLPRDGSGYERIKLMDITIKNEFFIPRTYELPVFSVCFYNEERGETGKDVMYYVVKVDGFEKPKSAVYSLEQITIPAYGEVNIEIYTGSGPMNYPDQGRNYRYLIWMDEILIYSVQEPSPEHCERTDDFESPHRIKILNKPEGDDSYIFECTDTDGGKNPDAKGIISGVGVERQEDECIIVDGKKVLSEKVCSGDKVSVFNVDCPNGCAKGACIPDDLSCTETDNGKDIFVKGTTDGVKATDFPRRSTLTDKCSPNGKTLYEYHCWYTNVDGVSGYFFGSNSIECPNGCRDGACVR